MGKVALTHAITIPEIFLSAFNTLLTIHHLKMKLQKVPRASLFNGVKACPMHQMRAALEITISLYTALLSPG